MSCNKGQRKCDGTMQSSGVPESGATWAGGRRDGEHCPKCGGYLEADTGVCNQCGGLGNPKMRRVDSGQNTDLSVADFLSKYGLDPLNNPAIQRLHENYVSIISGQEREVVLTTGCHTAATDLSGTVELNPYPLGASGVVADQLIVAREYIDHELGHELYTPRDMLIAANCIAKNIPANTKHPDLNGLPQEYRAIWQGASDLSQAERALLFEMVNVIEDARMERVIEAEEPYMWERMEAGQLLQPKDGGMRNGKLKGLPDYEQVLWATQMVGQSNYALTPDIKAGMTQRSLDAVDDLRPVIDRGVRGRPTDALESAIEIVRYLNREGMLPDNPQLQNETPSHTTGGESADGQASAGGSQQQQQQQQSGDGGQQQDTDSGTDQSDGQQGQSGSSAGDSDSDGQQQGHSGNSGPGERQCPDCGGFLDKNDVCTKCGNKADSDSGEQGNGQSGGGGSDADSDSGEQGGGQSGGSGSDADSGEQGDGQSGGGGSDADSDSGEQGGGQSGGGSDADSGEQGGGQPGGVGAGGLVNDKKNNVTGDGQPGVSPAPDPDKEDQRRIEARKDEVRNTLDEMRTAMTGEYNKAVKELMTTLEKQTAKKAAERTRPYEKKPILLTVTDGTGNQKRIAPHFYGYGEFPDREPYHGGIAEQRRLVQKNALRIGRGASQLANRLKRLKQQAQRDAYLQKRGSLDRRRLTAAVKGSDRVRMRQAPRRDTSMTASVVVDTSGSMFRYAEEVGTISGIIGKGLEMAKIPYEMRAFDKYQYHIKSFEEAKLTDEQVGKLYNPNGESTIPTPSIVAGGLALQTRQEAAKIQFVITDGAPAPTIYCPGKNNSLAAQDEVGNAVSKNAANGVITQGIFFAGPSGASRAQIAPKFDKMYGKDGWVYVENIEDIPKVVASHLEDQMKKLME